MNPIHTFTSHIAGKNAAVAIYPDRIEWTRKGSSVARATAATMTLGASLLRGRKEETETIPMKAITNVSTKRDGLMNSAVVVTTAGGQVAFRVSHDEAKRTRQVILQNMA